MNHVAHRRLSRPLWKLKPCNGVVESGRQYCHCTVPRKWASTQLSLDHHHQHTHSDKAVPLASVEQKLRPPIVRVISQLSSFLSFRLRSAPLQPQARPDLHSARSASTVPADILCHRASTITGPPPPSPGATGSSSASTSPSSPSPACWRKF